jgi:hypothetical protein
MTTLINASTSAGLVQTADTSGVLALQTAGTTAVTIDASQNVGIGTASPSFASGKGVQISASVGACLSLVDPDIAGTFDILKSGGEAYIFQRGNSPILFGTNDLERMRIDSSGNLLVGTTSQPSSSVVGIALNNNVASNASSWSCGSKTAANTMIQFINGNGQVGSIQTNGTATSYVTSSDYRLKENIAPMTGALATVQALKPVTYNWKVDGSSGQGFIAHELQAVVPDCVTGEKDAVDEEGKPVYQGIDTSFLVATLTAAIQEQQALITQLQADVAALKGVK